MEKQFDPNETSEGQGNGDSAFSPTFGDGIRSVASKNRLPLILCCCALFFSVASLLMAILAFRNSGRVAVFDGARVLQLSAPGQTARTYLQGFQKRLQESRQKFIQSHASSPLSQEDMARVDRSIADKLRQEDAAATQKVAELIKSAIEHVRIDSGYKAVFQVQGVNSLASDVDVTDRIIETMAKQVLTFPALPENITINFVPQRTTPAPAKQSTSASKK